MKGKIVFLKERKKFGFAEEPIPKVEDGAVLVKVLCTNICGSDVKNWKGSYCSDSFRQQAVLSGHEFVGEFFKLEKAWRLTAWVSR